MKKLQYPHPGTILLESFMEPLELTKYRVAKDLGVTASAIGEIVAGRRSISPDLALRLESYTGSSAKFWLNLQAGYDLEEARAKAPRAWKKITCVVPESDLAIAA